MTAQLPLVDECDYFTTVNADGKFVGKVDQFPDLRSKPCSSRIDATADIVTRTATHLRRLAGALPAKELIT